MKLDTDPKRRREYLTFEFKI